MINDILDKIAYKVTTVITEVYIGLFLFVLQH